MRQIFDPAHGGVFATERSSVRLFDLRDDGDARKTCRGLCQKSNDSALWRSAAKGLLPDCDQARRIFLNPQQLHFR
jgi:hypothetical protein